MAKYKMVTVVERFENEHKVPKERLSCGHVRTDPALYHNSAAFRIKRAFEAVCPNEPIKARCYKCAAKNG